MKPKNSRNLASALFLTFTLPAIAGDQNWDGGSLANGNWSDLLNWNGAVPGSTSVTTDTNLAIFNAAIVNTWGDAVGNPVVIDSATQNLGGFIFQTAPGNYFIGSTGGNTLRLTAQTTASDRSTIDLRSGIAGTNVVETINAPLSIYTATAAASIYTFKNNSANGAGVGAGTLNFGGPISGGSAQVITLHLNGSNTNTNTVSGNITSGLSTSFGINKSGAGTWLLGGTNSYIGDRLVRDGKLIITGDNAGGSRTTVGDATTNAVTLQLSGANGALSVANATAYELRNTGSLVLDNTDAAGGNNDNRIENTQKVLFNGGSLILKGADAAATNTAETLGALTVGSSVGGYASAFLNHNSLLSVRFGGTNTATLTVPSLTRPVTSIPTLLVNGSNLGMDSASTASVGRILLTAAPALTGTTNASATGIDPLVKNTKIVPFLIGEATVTTGGLGTATGTANTFVTHNATSGLRPLNPADEFTNNAITAGHNTYITAPTATSGSAAINSLVINGADLTITDGDTLTNTSGAILIASNHTIKPSSSTGTLAFGSTEAQITINSGVTTRITAPITGTGAVTFSGPGTLQVAATTSFASLAGNAALDLAAGSALTVGSNNASTTYSGALSGSGSLTKTGGGTLSIGTNSITGNGINDDFLFSGDINVSGGNLTAQFASEINTKSKLTISTGGTMQLNGNMSVFSLFGTGGSLTNQSPSGGATLTVNYTGTDPAAGFTGTLTSAASNYANTIQNAGSGDLTFGTMINGAKLNSVGTGKVTAVAISGANGGVMVSTPFARAVLTGNTGVVNGGTGVTQLYGGTLTLAPTGSGANVLVTGQAMTGTFRVRISGGGTLQLDKGSNTSIEYRVGQSTNTNGDFLQFVSNGSGPGSLILDPVYGAATLGTTAKFTILNSTTAKILSNGILPIPMVVVDNDGTKKGDFVTYNGTGVAGDVGYQQATYTLTDTFAGSTNASVVKNTVAQTISADTSAFALRNDNIISIDASKTLTLGAPPAVNANATATQSPNTGLILNGGTISGDGTLAFGTTAAVIYTSNPGGTISASMTGSGGTNAGYGAYNGYSPVSMIKFGAGTLTLSGINLYTGATVINAGAVDVGTITASGGLNNKLSGSSGNLTFGGGVIQGNGTFARGLGQGANQVTWNGINNTNSQQSGGFAAKGGDLTVAIGGTGSPTALTWGIAATNQNNVAGWIAPQFIAEVGNVGNPGGQTGILMFGSDTSDSQVDFKNAIDLGNVTANGTTGFYASPNYYRIIHVAQGTGADSAKISGNISSTVVHGLIKDGPGKLILAGTNSYTGDTVVAHGSLELSGTHAATPNITVNPGATYSLTNVGTGLGFTITNTASSSINGGGTATLDGTFTLNTAAVTNTTGSWTLVSATTKTFAANFSVAGFAPSGDGITWTVTEEGTRLWTFSETTGVLTLSVAPTNTFDSWMGTFDFSAFPSADLTPSGDADGDGIENAVEMVIGNAPNQNLVANLPASSLVTDPIGVPAGNYLKFAYRRTTASVDASVTSSVYYDTDLVAPWTLAVDGVDGVEIIETPNVGLPGTDVEVYIPRGANTKLFGRLAAEVPAP